MRRLGSARTVIAVLVPVFVFFSLFPRQASPVDNAKIRVVASLFPQFDFARQVGGDRAETALLLPPGVEAHSFEPKPRDIAKINEADIFIYTDKDMEPWADKIIKGVSGKSLVIVEAGKGAKFISPPAGDGHNHTASDPHIWMDMDNAAVMVDNIAEAFIAKDPASKEYYLGNAAKYKAGLKRMDEKFRATFSGCRQDTFAYAGHPSFNYFNKRYNLKCVSPYKGLCPDSEPSPKAVMEVVDTVKRKGLGYVYYEELLSPKLANTIAGESGARVLPLSGAHNITKEDMNNGVTFLSIMEENLENLKKGMECRNKY
jgi:zinc transport system substrate-binding protein